MYLKILWKMEHLKQKRKNLENGAFAPKEKILWKMEHLYQKSKCSIFHNIFKGIQNLTIFSILLKKENDVMI